MTGKARRDEIRRIHREYKLLYVVMAVVLTLGVGIWIGAAIFADDPGGYAMNLVTEGFGVAVSVVITVFVIDRIYERRDEERQTRELKRRLVREAGSRSNDIAIAAIEHLHANDWLAGPEGWLRNARLDYAEWQNTNLRGANLELAWLWRANLHGADLFGANLKGAYLSSANLQTDLRFVKLQEAIMSFANLQGSRLTHANLKGADMENAYIQNADLRGADLQGALLTNTMLEEATLSTRAGNDDFDHQLVATLPDGSLHTEDIDLAKFTDSTHPDFEATRDKIFEIRRAHGLDNRLPPAS